ncbi:MAG: AlpA family phage regulatory protein [Burkholderiaceae bacterium]|nr:AlpA family phage regulatory protein [Burkholderiaceae bacterium]
MATILRIDGVLGKTGQRSKSAIYCAAREGLFTKPVKIGAQITGWPDYEVETIVAAQVAGQTKDEIRELVNQLHAQRMERFKILMQPLQGTSTTDTTNVVQMAGAR